MPLSGSPWKERRRSFFFFFQGANVYGVENAVRCYYTQNGAAGAGNRGKRCQRFSSHIYSHVFIYSRLERSRRPLHRMSRDKIEIEKKRVTSSRIIIVSKEALLLIIFINEYKVYIRAHAHTHIRAGAHKSIRRY